MGLNKRCITFLDLLLPPQGVQVFQAKHFNFKTGTHGISNHVVISASKAGLLSEAVDLCTKYNKQQAHFLVNQ